MILDDDLIGCYRLAACALACHACGEPPKWRGKDDPVYQAIVEGRDKGARRKTYSSCADLAHWLWYRLGVRAPWVNRDEHAGFKDVVNVSRLAYACKQALTPGRAHAFGMGDTLIVWNKADTSDAHVCVLLEGLDPEPEAGFAPIANYGATGMSVRAWPGCNITNPRMVWDAGMGLWSLGGRYVQRTLGIARVLRAQEVLALPQLEGADLPGEVIDRLMGLPSAG